MSMPSANMLLDEVLRGIAVSAVFRGVFERKPIFSQGTINLVYSVARDPIAKLIPQLGQVLPNSK